MRTGVRRGAMAARSAWRGVDDRRAGRSRLHLLHIGKTGGTALKAAFGGGDVVTASHRLVLHDHGFTLADVPDGEHAVVVLRDPIARFVSGFDSRRRRGRPRYDVPWSPGEAAAFTRFPTADTLARALGDPSTGARAVAAMRAIRHVRDPLTHYLGDAGTLATGRIALAGDVTDLATVVADLTDLIGAPAVTLPTDPVAAHRAPTPATALSTDGEANIRHWYSGDYAVIERLRRDGLLRRT